MTPAATTRSGIAAAQPSVYGPPPDSPMTTILSMPSVSAMVRRSSANAEHGVVLYGVDDPMPGPVDTDQPDVLLFGVDAGLHRDLAAGTGRSVQPEDGAALRVTELGESDLAVIADGDVAFELGTGDCDSHGQSVSRRVSPLALHRTE